MSFPGFLTPGGLFAGANALLFINAAQTPRSIGNIVMNITVEEEGTDELEITEHPVEQGAMISDHAFKRPASLRIRAMSSNAARQASADPNYVSDVYRKLLTLQSSGQVFTIVTGKRTYSNMLMRALRQTTDQATETTLAVDMEFREIIIARTAPASLPPVQQQALPAQTAAPQNLGAKQFLPGVPINPPVN